MFTKCQTITVLTNKMKGSLLLPFIFVVPLQCQLTDNGPIDGLSINNKVKGQSYEKD